MNRLKALEILQEICNCNDRSSFLDEAIKELEELENRSCGNCKHWIGLYCRTYNINSDFNFYCNKWENKA